MKNLFSHLLNRYPVIEYIFGVISFFISTAIALFLLIIFLGFITNT